MRADEWPSFATQSFMNTAKKNDALVSGAPPARTTPTSRYISEMNLRVRNFTKLNLDKFVGNALENLELSLGESPE